MLIVKYSKTGPAKYASHVDTLRAMGRILARADVSVGYSEGFNPHALLFFSPPNAVGVDSLCEYVAVAAGEERDFIGRFNAAAPCGFTALRVWTTHGNPNLAGVIDGARYEIKSPGIGTADYGKIKDGFVVEYDGKDGKKSKDYASYVISVTTENDDKITAVLKYGNENLRPDRFVGGVRTMFGIDGGDAEIIKTAAFVKGEDVDDFLDKLHNKTSP